MDKEKTEYAIISNAVDILCILCAGSRGNVIDLLTGYLWDEEEASGIKESSGRFDLVEDVELEIKRLKNHSISEEAVEGE